MCPQHSKAKEPAATRLTAILSKQPVAGQVKTRLCPPLEPSQAADLAEAMLADAIARCNAASADGGFQCALWYAPPSAGAWFERAAAGFSLWPQVGAGLGERMAHAFDEGLGQPGIDSMVIIGSDQPLVGRKLLLEAHDSLEAGADLVLGPDAGGGYYLIGLRRPQPELFTSIVMSTGCMRDETLALARSMGLRVKLLAPGYDVDLQSDLERLSADLAAWQDHGHPDFPRHSLDFMNRLPGPLARLLNHG